MKQKSAENIAYINPKVLGWALSRTDLSRDQLAKKLGIDTDEIASWEKGSSRPPFDKSQKLAQTLNIPFGYFFLSKPPSVDVPIPDMRIFADGAPFGSNFVEVVNDALTKQDWYRDHIREIGGPKLPYVGSFTIEDDIGVVAASIRKTIGITSTLRRSASTWGEYVSRLAQRSEDAGILVMRSGVVGNSTRRKVSSREFQGFALADPYAPVVFINSDDFKAAQVFTLAHELAHIWIGSSAISKPDPTTPDDVYSAVELFCNDVAVETLVPTQEFEPLWNQSDVESLIARLSRIFWVSTLVILRRAHELEKLSKLDFQHYVALERKKIKKIPSSGGDFYRNVTARMGSKFSSAVLAEMREGRLLYRDAAQLLRLKVPTLFKFSEHSK